MTSKVELPQTVDHPDEQEKWSRTVGEYGAKVGVYERNPGGYIYIRIPDTRYQSGYQVKSLGHKDKERALEQAKSAHEKLGASKTAAVSSPLLGGISSEKRFRNALGRTIRHFTHFHVETELAVPGGGRVDIGLLENADAGEPSLIIEVKTANPRAGIGQTLEYAEAFGLHKEDATLAVPESQRSRRLRQACKSAGIRLLVA